MSLKSPYMPEMPDLLGIHKKEIFSQLNAIQIGIINSFDATNQTASIQLVFKQVIDITPDGVKTLKERPLIMKCPVITLFGGTSFVSLPIAVGDTCVVLFNDREIDQWFQNDGIQTPVSERMHDVSDAIAIVGIRSLQNSIANYFTNGIRLAYDEGSVKIDLQSAAINSLADLFTHTGNMLIKGTFEVEQETTLDSTLLVKDDTEIEGDLLVDGGLSVLGEVKGTGGVITITDNVSASGKTISSGTMNGDTIHAGNGATGTFGTVTVVDGIVTGGT